MSRRNAKRMNEFDRRVDVATGETYLPVKGKLAKAVDDVLRAKQELKYIDTSSSYSNVGASGTISNLTAIVQGSSGIQRTGDYVRLKHIVLRVAGYQNNTTAVQPPNIVRVMIFRWTLNNAVSAPAVGDVLTTASLANPGGSITSHYNSLSLKTEALQVLHDSYHYTSLNNTSFAYAWEMKLDSEVNFNPTASTGYNNLYILLQADDAGVVSPCPSVAFTSRVTFADG